MSKFSAGGRISPIPLVEKPCIYIYIYIYIYINPVYYTYAYIKELCQQVSIYNEEAPCTSYTSCAQVAILVLQDLSPFCVTDIYGIYIYIYIFACLFIVCNTINLSRYF